MAASCPLIAVLFVIVAAGVADAQSTVELAADPVAFVEAASTDAAVDLGCANAAAPCQCAACQARASQLTAAADLKKAAAGAYKPLFYDNDFSYLSNPNYSDWHLGEHFKQVPIGDCWTLDLGGQYRARYMDEQNMRGLGLTGRDDNFLLHRTRLYMNGRYSDWFRAYGEFIDATDEFNDFPERLIEVNRADMLNLFADARVWDGDNGDLWFRIGRQELLYGAERLISPLDWANTRRTFEGLKFFWQGEDWNADFFAVRPVFPVPDRFDSAEYKEEFFGGWATYKAIPNQTIDLFTLQYNSNRGLNDFRYTTMGGRWIGSEGDFLWETEGGVQFGQNTDGSGHGAGFVTGGLGRRWSDRDWKPQLMAYYDWANGTNDRGAGNGFNHLFPLAHKYLGFMDLYGRSNIESPNLQFTMQPHPKLKVLVWYYYLFLQNGNDTPYSVVMTPFNPANAPASRDLGHEIDLLFTYSLTPRMELLFGYSHFFAGDYYKLTPGVPYDGDANFFYTHFQVNF